MGRSVGGVHPVLGEGMKPGHAEMACGFAGQRLRVCRGWAQMRFLFGIGTSATGHGLALAGLSMFAGCWPALACLSPGYASAPHSPR